MKSIAKVTLVALLLFAGFQLALAQQPSKNDGANRTPPDPAQMAERQTERMTKTLNLSADQSKQVQAINLKYAQQHRAAKSVAGAAAPTQAERQAKHEQRKAVRDQQNAELKAVLTPAQQATWEKERAEHKGKHGDKGKKGGNCTKTKKA